MCIVLQPRGNENKKIKISDSDNGAEDMWLNVDSCPPSPTNSDVLSEGSGVVSTHEDTSNEALVVDLDQNAGSSPSKFTCTLFQYWQMDIN